MSAILHNEPPELTETNRNVPPALERIVRHCLEKVPEERFQSAGDIAFDLESLQTASGGTPVSRAPAKHNRRLLWPLAFLLLVLLGAAAFMLGRQSGGSHTAVVFHRITYERGSVISARFASDGHSVVYDGAWEGKPPHLFSTPATIPEPRALDLENAHLFAVSRSGEAALGIGGRVANHLALLGSTLARSPLGGGAPRELLRDVAAADWSPGGNLAVVHYTGGRTRLEYPIGTVLYETGGWIGDLHFSPAGDKLAFLDHRFWPDDRGWVAVVDLSGHKKTLTGEWEAEDGLAWAPGGNEIWFTATAAGVDRSLYAVDLSGKQRLLLSIPGSLRLHDIYLDGRVLLSATHERVGMIGVSAESNKQHDLSWSGWTIANDISPDGKTVVFSEESEFGGANYTLAVRTLDGSPPVKLSEGVVGRYSADGKYLTAVIADQPNHFTVLPTGAGEPKDIPVAGLTHLLSADFMPNNEFLVAGTERGHGSRCFVRSVDGDRSKPSLRRAKAHAVFPKISSMSLPATASGRSASFRWTEVRGTRFRVPRECSRSHGLTIIPFWLIQRENARAGCCKSILSLESSDSYGNWRPQILPGFRSSRT